jgi:subtilisin family serine protease
MAARLSSFNLTYASSRSFLMFDSSLVQSASAVALTGTDKDFDALNPMDASTLEAGLETIHKSRSKHLVNSSQRGFAEDIQTMLGCSNDADANLDSLNAILKQTFLPGESLDRATLKAMKAGEASRKSGDRLTGIGSASQLVGTSKANALQSNRGYDPAYGHGLVNAAHAVAWARGWNTPYPDVGDWGGVHWGNDMVKAPEVWNQGFAGQGITVAVIDSGVDIFHPDLDNNIWYNSGEIFGDGIDNDANGYVDDIAGWNFGANSSNVLDGNGHGTHVAGTIAAEFNDFGMTGIAPFAKIMPLKIGDADAQGRLVNAGNLAEAIIYAVDNGANVINMSLGWEPSQQLVNALAYAASRDVITVSASGNQGLAAPGAPATFATHFGLSVGAVDQYGWLANFSNWAGNNAQMHHVVAPGMDVVSTIPGGYYDFKDGTSMAAPHVAGVVALMLSANPYLTHDQVRFGITASATDFSFYGYGGYSFAQFSADIETGLPLPGESNTTALLPASVLEDVGDRPLSRDTSSSMLSDETTIAIPGEQAMMESIATSMTDAMALTPIQEQAGVYGTDAMHQWGHGSFGEPLVDDLNTMLLLHTSA